MWQVTSHVVNVQEKNRGDIVVVKRGKRTHGPIIIYVSENIT
jgi:hypothetical protein